jgi:hypothetical protein
MTSERLIEILEDAELSPESYSGRAMYGARCVSVSGALVEAAVGAAAVLVAGDDAEDVAHLMSTTKSDSLGLGIVLYWPSMRWPADADGEED